MRWNDGTWISENVCKTKERGNLRNENKTEEEGETKTIFN